jgi:hypothetical protein
LWSAAIATVRVAQEHELALAGFLQAVGDHAAAQLPARQEGLALGQDRAGAVGVHHVVELSLDLVVQVLGSVGEQVAFLVHGATLHRHVSCHALGSSMATF